MYLSNPSIISAIDHIINPKHIFDADKYGEVNFMYNLSGRAVLVKTIYCLGNGIIIGEVDNKRFVITAFSHNYALEIKIYRTCESVERLIHEELIEFPYCNRVEFLIISFLDNY